MYLYLVKATGEVVAVANRSELENALRRMNGEARPALRVGAAPFNTKHTSSRELPYSGYRSGVVYIGEHAPDALAVNHIVEHAAPLKSLKPRRQSGGVA